MDSDHSHSLPDTIGIPRSGSFDPTAFERAVVALLNASGVAALEASSHALAQARPGTVIRFRHVR